MDAGNLVPDNVVIELIEEALKSENTSDNFILDGFPRTLPQAEALDELFRKLKIKLDCVVSIEADGNEIVRRLDQRRICRKCGRICSLDSLAENDKICGQCGGEIYKRDDDNQDAVRRRLEVYQQQTSPIIEYYRKTNRLKAVDGMGEVEHVHKLILDALNKDKIHI
jgi:adenylate kinase